MKATVWRGVGDVRLEDVPEPGIEDATDAIVRITTSAICGTDLHFLRGTFPGMVPGTILGHEGVGIIERLGREVRNFKEGDRVVLPSTLACGVCSYCREGLYAQCNGSNPNGPSFGTTFYGGPRNSGPFNGLQAEKARVPFASMNMIKLPPGITDDQAILLSDIFPTGYFAAELADIKAGDSVVIFGCGPVGQFAIASAKLMGAGRVFAVDSIESRLEMARMQGAEVLNFEHEDPIENLQRLTGRRGPSKVIDAVGVDAAHPHSGPAFAKAKKEEAQFQKELDDIAPQLHPDNGNWHPGGAPSQVLKWATEIIAKAGTIAIVGAYPPGAEHFPIGQAMNKNLTIRMGNCHHRRYIPTLIRLVLNGIVNPAEILTQVEDLTSVIDAYRAFDRRAPGWMKVALREGETHGHERALRH